jgi:succinate-semialdehyde dehydrogenase/glutarate-semialdehyde dehydrogenase
LPAGCNNPTDKGVIVTVTAQPAVSAERESALLASVPTGLLINGEWRDAASGKTFDVEDPATGKVLLSIADAGPEDGAAALDAAAAAQESWAKVPSRERGEILRRAFDLVTERAEDFALLMTMEMGKPLAEARGEVTYGAEFLRWFSEEAVRAFGRYSVSPDGKSRLLVTKKPVGPCLLITPWNFPLAMATRKIAPAVAAGCTMVLKSANLTPLTSQLFAAVMLEAGLPAGVLNVIPTSTAGATTGPLIKDSGCASSPSPVPPRWAAACSPTRPKPSCAPPWNSAATPRSWSSRTPTSTPPSPGPCSPSCGTWAKPAPRQPVHRARVRRR